MKRIIKSLLLFTALLIITTSIVHAHSGRTDARGGHRDNKNKSGLGSYHYHCGGYPAHMHSNGTCPYVISNDKTPKQSTFPPIIITPTSTPPAFVDESDSPNTTNTANPTSTYFEQESLVNSFSLYGVNGFNNQTASNEKNKNDNNGATPIFIGLGILGVGGLIYSRIIKK